ncbi:hypothetical protein L484_007611 [Morus notabilis]|uniref:HNH endonuclease n=1 Tax=Morus notabilis TaxID=981085 RepID=W9S3G7_9ROSA|nr:hypothetical protein L484_007611 [Morus notabilis]
MTETGGRLRRLATDSGDWQLTPTTGSRLRRHSTAHIDGHPNNIAPENLHGIGNKSQINPDKTNRRRQNHDEHCRHHIRGKISDD